MNKRSGFLAIAIPTLALNYPLSSWAQLEEVIVTATKVESSIQDTPIAVTAFSQDQLDSQLINDHESAVQRPEYDHEQAEFHR